MSRLLKLSLSRSHTVLVLNEDDRSVLIERVGIEPNKVVNMGGMPHRHLARRGNCPLPRRPQPIRRALDKLPITPDPTRVINHLPATLRVGDGFEDVVIHQQDEDAAIGQRLIQISKDSARAGEVHRQAAGI